MEPHQGSGSRHPMVARVLRSSAPLARPEREREAGGLGPKTAEIARLLAAAGFEMILIETVGAGQNDVAVRNVADQVLLLLMPGAGDSVQFTKAGVVEIATGFVVNKADLPGADKTIKDLRETLDDDRPIWSVSSLRGEGLEPLCEWIEQNRQR